MVNKPIGISDSNTEEEEKSVSASPSLDDEQSENVKPKAEHGFDKVPPLTFINSNVESGEGILHEVHQNSMIYTKQPQGQREQRKFFFDCLLYSVV